MKHALIQAVIERRNTANDARQRYDDASAGVNEDPLRNAQARLEAADALTDATYELVHLVDGLLDQIAKDHGGVSAGDLDWLLAEDGGSR